VDKAGADYWLYRLDGHLPYPQPMIELPTQPHVERAEPALLDQVYRAFLAALPLSSIHRQALRQRGLPDAEILRRGYRTMPRNGRAALAQCLVDRFGADTCAKIPGFSVDAQGTRRWCTLAGAPGLLIPVRNVDGRIIAVKIRADYPGEGPKYTYLSSSNHHGPGPGAPVHVPLHILTAGTPIRITEGELKADVATLLSGVLTLSVPGVSVWRPVLQLLQQLGVTTVHLAFDADWRHNPHVARALAQATQALVDAGYTVGVETWDAFQGKGIDNVLRVGYTPVLQSAEPWLQRARAISAPRQPSGIYQHRQAARIACYKRQLYADPYFGAPERRAKGIPVAVLKYQETSHEQP
jgi:hypothetical protein